MFCSECGHDMRLTSEPMKERYHGEDFVVDGVERYVCDECGNYAVSAKMSDLLATKLAEARARAHGMLAPSEIRSLRRSLRLNQSEFEGLLGVSKPTACRWERGTVLQSKTADLLMRVAREVPGAAAYLGGLTGLSVRDAGVRATVRATDGWGQRSAGKAGTPSAGTEAIGSEEMGLVA